MILECELKVVSGNVVSLFYHSGNNKRPHAEFKGGPYDLIKSHVNSFKGGIIEIKVKKILH